jgi:hypothetical protein
MWWLTDERRPPIKAAPHDIRDDGAFLMARRPRFRWTRSRYRKATSLLRYFNRHVYDLPSDPPAMLRRLWSLWEKHPQKDDPLLMPLRQRAWLRDDDSDIPF